jgi:hypothetical protein
MWQPSRVLCRLEKFKNRFRKKSVAEGELDG